MSTDCRDCGACCFSDSDAYVPLGRVDVERLGESNAHLVHTDASKRYMRMALGRCAALRLVGGRWTCSVYTLRPDACHALKRGSAACLEERSIKLRRARDAEALA